MLLTRAGIDLALPRVAEGLAQYCWLQQELALRNVSADRHYQRSYNHFYRVRRSVEWQKPYFTLLEQGKSAPLALSDVMQEMHAATGRVEASFCSKLVATLDPALPVIDSVVLSHFGLRLPARGAASARIEEIVVLYDGMRSCFEEFLESSDGVYLVAEFGRRFPDRRVSSVKALDLVLWQSRSG